MTNVKTYNFQRAGSYIVSASNCGSDNVPRSRIRGNINVTGAGMLVAGTVMGKLTSNGTYSPFDPTASDGTETASAILFSGVDTGATPQAGQTVSAPLDTGEMAVHGAYLVLDSAVVTTSLHISNAIDQLTSAGFTIRNMADVVATA